MRSKYQPSFSRRGSRKLTERKQDLFDNLLPELLIDIDKDINIAKDKETWVEIGFGGGEHLAAQAKNNADVDFIGCDPFKTGIAKLLCYIADDNLKNIRIFGGDARILTDKLPKNSIDKIFILFSDPWPKKRHHQKRLINDETLVLLHSVMKDGTILRIASDFPNYIEWILEHLKRSEFFKIIKSDSKPYDDFVPTKYYKKALREGREPMFFECVKV